jgi:NADPH:quinone reductase-like Zn-dependent oxidoreductase
MRAAYLSRHGGPEVIEIGEIPTPVAGPGEALVRVKAAALNHLDLWVRGGLPGLKLQYPHVLGGDASGVVESVGPGVTSVKAGDEVIVHPGLSCLHCEACLSGWESLCPQYKILGEHVSGTHAEYVKVPAANLFPKGAALSFDEAAALPLVFTTAWQMVVRRAEVKPGELVVIHGAGSGVSTAAIQIAVLHGAEIVVTSGSDRKLERAKALGAHHLVNYKTQDFSAEVKQLRKRGADVIVDHVGRDFWDKNIRCLKSGGRLVTCGATSGHAAETDLRHLFFRQLSLLGSTMGSKGDFPTILRHVASGKLRAVVDRAFPLAQTVEAQRYLSEQEQFGKVLLHP